MAEDKGNKPNAEAMLLHTRGELAHRKLLAKDPRNLLRVAEEQALKDVPRNRPSKS